MDIYESLNSILVTLFNDIMNIEEKALITDEFSDITVTDMHIIEAIGIKEPRTMGTISKALGVTMGTLTVGINGLVKKGYVIRTRSEEDRRVVYASLTPKGNAAYKLVSYNGYFDWTKSRAISEALKQKKLFTAAKVAIRITAQRNAMKKVRIAA